MTRTLKKSTPRQIEYGCTVLKTLAGLHRAQNSGWIVKCSKYFSGEIENQLSKTFFELCKGSQPIILYYTHALSHSRRPEMFFHQKVPELIPIRVL
jgi:hypothetical protein